MDQCTTNGEMIVLIPVFDDWESAMMLVSNLDDALRRSCRPVEVVIVNDGSTTPIPDPQSVLPIESVRKITVVDLVRNLGHQRGICVGLWWCVMNRPGAPILVMDGDGEDRPADVPRLVDEFERNEGRLVVFGGRTKRSETWIFRIFYQLYRLLHWLLVGRSIGFGNFSVLPSFIAKRLLTSPDLWNHYAASVVCSRIPYQVVPCKRGVRYMGHSKMNFTGLVSHGIGALSVFGHRIVARWVVFCFVSLIVFASLFLFSSLLWFYLLSPFWMVCSVVFLVFTLGFVAFSFLSFLCCFFVLSTRASSRFFPVEECRRFFDGSYTFMDNGDR